MTSADTTSLLSSEIAAVGENPSLNNRAIPVPVSRLRRSADAAPSPASMDADFENINDSGYSSQSTASSGYSLAEKENTNHETPILSSLQPGDGKSKTSRTPSINLFDFARKKQIFQVDVDDDTNERFKFVQTHFEKLLLEHVRAHQTAGTRYKPMSTRLVMIGCSRDDASPHIVVFCQPGQKRLVKQFATNPMIKDICQPSDSGIPSFKIKVIGNAPQLKLSDLPVKVTTDDFRKALTINTFCGTPIQFSYLFNKRNATFGGIIKVEWEMDEKFYGITAGHAVEECLDESQPAKESTDEYEDDADSEDGDMDMEFLRKSVPSYDTLDEEGKQWQFAKPLVLGSIVTHSGVPVDIKDQKNQGYDWAIFETNVYKVNELPDSIGAELVLSHREPGATGDPFVYMVSGSGFKVGQLSSTPGRILLGSGEEFVSTYLLTIHDERCICDGDSGSWVIDAQTFEVYGHLVAADVLGSGYVIPLSAIFADIKQRLRAEAVTLANNSDILHALSAKRDDEFIDSAYSSLRSSDEAII
ncbi:hypothetical protein F4805DRAFT_15044 [Annulohypoxylon moriforme]|nr:hypothetical protein F4805DRAFT_15044 [Annulohypoxylon moriforme]